MSQENVEIVRRSFEAIGRWDIDGLLELYDPHVQFLPLTGTRVESGGYRGHAGVRAYFEEVANVWDELHPYGDDFRTVGDNVVVLGGCMVRGRGSGAEADTPMAWSCPCARARSRAIVATEPEKTPSKPPGCRSRRCRGRTSSLSTETVDRSASNPVRAQGGKGTEPVPTSRRKRRAARGASSVAEVQ
jgi:ketosteroid isomerase-like protein